MMKRLFLLLLALWCTSAVCCLADDWDYYVETWDYKATVHTDNSWDVTEQITVNFVQPHHGIFLYKPRVFYDMRPYGPEGEEASYRYELKIKDVRVPDEHFEAEGNDDDQHNLVVQIGDSYRTISGQHTYTILYTVQYPDDRIDRADYVLHSVLGDGWPSSIRHFTFDVRFDQPLTPQDIDQSYICSGSWDSMDDVLGVADSCFIDAYSISGSVHDVPGNHAITFGLTLPEGYFHSPSGSWHWLFWCCLLASIALIIYLIPRELRTRVQRPVPVVSFYPPKGINSAEVGTIIDESADVKDLISLIPWFAQQGYIRIIEEIDKGLIRDKHEVTLERLHPLPDDAPYYQHKFLEALFPKGDTQRLSKLGDRHKEIGEAMTALKATFKGEQKLSDTSWSLAFCFLLVAAIFGLYLSDYQCAWVNIDRLGVGLIFLILQVMLLIARLFYSSRRAFSPHSGWWSALLCIGCAVIHAGVLFLWSEPQNDITSGFLLPVLAIASYVAVLFSDRLSTDTPYRIQLTGELLGLREFIKVAEKDRIEMLVDQNPEYFYDILPYAMVFDQADKWARKFRDIKMEVPTWYSGNDAAMHGIMSGNFAQSLSDTLNHSVSSAVSASSHDPSSSHGGAGGGGGGGGGGAW